MPIDDQEDLLRDASGQPLAERTKGLGRGGAFVEHEAELSGGTERLLSANRAPVASTTGVLPWGAQVWPLW